MSCPGRADARSAYDFEEAAPYYDRASRLVGFGTGRWYRRWSLARAGLRPGMAVLDVGTGTGAVARSAVELLGGTGRVVGADPSRAMLARAARPPRLSLLRATAEALPFRDGAFDFVSFGFSLRYLADVPAALREGRRVLRPGGIVLVLDLARPRSRWGYRVARLYLQGLVPWLARVTLGREGRSLMRYCWSAVDRAGSPGVLDATLAECGFALQRRTVWFGIMSEHVAVNARSPDLARGA
jgi:demethylmenaquinone methyltransferase/2-methoxy-6-polyprenyl-1,4-benzoquinol methylase